MNDFDFAFIVLLIFGIIFMLLFSVREARDKDLADQHNGVPVYSEQIRLKND